MMSVIVSAVFGWTIAALFYAGGALQRRWLERAVTSERLAVLDARLQHGDEVRRLWRERKKRSAYELYKQETGASSLETRVGIARLTTKPHRTS